MSERPPILCASTQYWDETWFRKQHFMRRLSRSRPVLYIEPSFSVLRRPSRGCPEDAVNPWLRPRLRRRDGQLWSWTPPRGLPFWTHRSVSALQYRWYGRLLRREIERQGWERARLWLYNPLYVQSLPTLPVERVIFDLVDDLAAYESAAHSRRTMTECVQAALARADLVLATSRRLAEQYGSRTRRGRIEVVPNGVAGEWLADGPRPVPPELWELPRPRLGFIGAVFGYLDFSLLRAAARAYPRGSLTLVGPVLHEEGARLAEEPNVRLLGPRPQSAIPDYIAAFDVCLCPFLPGPVRRAVNPLKVYEYLALGRPVVSTPLESLLDDPVARWIRFAEGPDEFVAAIRAALREDEPSQRQGRREAVRPYTWEALGERVESVLEAAEGEWR